MVLALLLSHTALGARERGFDLSTGVVGPSENSAVFENGSALVRSRTAFEALIEPTGGDLDFEATVVTTSDSLGLGAGFRQLGGSSNLLAGLGFGLGAIALGVDTEFNFNTEAFQLDASLSAGSRDLRFAFVVEDLLDGIGLIKGGVLFPLALFRMEVDAEFDVPTDTLALTPAIAIAVEWVRFMFGLRIPITNGGNADARFGLMVWPTSQVGVEYLYSQRLGEHNFGLKLPL